MENTSNEEIIEIFKKIEKMIIDKDENLCELKKLHEEIVSKSSFVVYSNTNRYKNFSNYEDLVQEGFIGIIYAIKKFDYKLFPNFFIYCEKWVRHYIKKAASRFDIVYVPDKNRVLYSDISEKQIDEIAKNPEEMYFEKESKVIINKILDSYGRDGSITKKIFGCSNDDQMSLREIGKQCNLTHEGVRQIKNNFLKNALKEKKFDNLY